MRSDEGKSGRSVELAVLERRIWRQHACGAAINASRVATVENCFRIAQNFRDIVAHRDREAGTACVPVENKKRAAVATEFVFRAVNRVSHLIGLDAESTCERLAQRDD